MQRLYIVCIQTDLISSSSQYLHERIADGVIFGVGGILNQLFPQLFGVI
jgi:hypothetical protein